MYNTYVTSAVTHRTRGSPSFSFSGYSYLPNARYSFVCSSPRICLCCSCCANSMYKLPLSPGYCCDLSASRQSSLIQCRKFGFGGFNPCYYSREPVYDADRRFYCDKMCNASKERGRLRKCLVIEERNESHDLDEVGEADVLLSLLSEDIGEECFRVRKVIKRPVKKPGVKKKENSMSKDGQAKLGVLGNDAGYDYEMSMSSSRKENKRQEGGKRDEKRDTSLKKENQKARIQFEMIEKGHEQKPFLRKEVSKSKEQRAETLRREEHRGRLRKDVSSCSSYYSFSSAGDYESENDTEHNEGKFVGDKSSVAINEIAYKEGTKVDEKRNDYTKNTARESRASSSVIGSDFRKSSEKKLIDLPIQEKEYREGALLKDSGFSMVQETDRGESSNSSRKYENREVKSSGSHVLDIEKKKLVNKQTRNEVSVQSEQNMKYKQFMATDNNDVRKFYGSQNRYSNSDDVSAKVTSSSQKSVVNCKSDNRSTNKMDENQMNSLKVCEVSNVIDVDIKKASFSGKVLESHVKTKEDCSMDMRTSSFEAQKKHQYDEVSKSQQLTIRENTSMLKESSDGRSTEHEENVDWAYGSSLGSKQPHLQINTDFIAKVGSQPSAIFLKEHDKKNSGLVRTEPTSRSTTEIRQVQEDAIGSASRLHESLAKYVGVFVDKARHEISSSQIQLEKKTSEERKEHKILVQDSSQSSKLKETDSRLVSHSSGIKGPSDEIWKLDEQVVPESQEGANNTGNIIQKRTGRSLWNIIGDIIRLRLSSRSESRSTGAKSSPNQSTSSDTWFSGHEGEENEESKTAVTEEPSKCEEKIGSRNEETSILSTIEGHLEHAEVDVPSSSVFLKLSSNNSGGTSDTASILESTSTLQLQRSFIQQSVSEAGEANIFESGPEEQHRGNEKELKRGKLQRKDQIIKDKYDEWGEACRVEAEQRKVDEVFMKAALLEAQKAGDNWEVPVGAVLVHNGQIISRGCNLVEELRDSTAHAEMICIREASNVLRSWRLSETTLYVTLEPCPMCAGAILQARIDTVVWGAPNKLLGADGSWIRLFPNGKGVNELEESDKPAAPVHPFHPKITIRRGILASECAETMQEFFQLRRKKKDKKLEASSSSTPLQLPPPHHHHPSKFLRRMHDAFMYCL